MAPNTPTTIERLRAGGFNEQQAEALSATLEGLATKTDIQGLRGDIKDWKPGFVAELVPYKWVMAISLGLLAAILTRLYLMH